jgi:glycosyltransferase involved in cell wall biosynthesis
MAGDGSIAECRIRAVELGIEDAVELKGWLPTKEVIRAYSRAAIFCLPSYSEGLPMVVLEAMALGLPVISTSVGGIPDIIVTGENGLLIAPGDVEALAGAIITLLRDSTLRFRLSQRAMGTVRARYSVDTIASQLRAYYQELLPSRAAKGANVGVSKH